MLNFKEKYLKYKIKYNNLLGGLIGKIDYKNLLNLKNEEETPEVIKKYIDIVTIPKTKIIRVGSSKMKIQKYYSDIDIMNIVSKLISTEELIKFFIENLKKIIISLEKYSDVFFSDFKAGGLHWTKEQILEEKNGELTLYNACLIKNVIKIDIIGPLYGRYLEISTFFILKSATEFINVNSDYFEKFESSLLKDILEYHEIKPFKAVKRVWSLARITNDNKTIELLKDIILSNISLIDQIASDIKTIILLVEKKIKYDLNFILLEFDGIRERLSIILDIKIDFEKVNLMIDIIQLHFRFQNTNEEEIINSCLRLHDYLFKLNNNETLEFLTSINYKFPLDHSLAKDNNSIDKELLDIL